jgi:dolichol-phosphate mannosyltransferase
MIITEPPAYTITELRTRATRYCVVIMIWNESERILNQLKRLKPYAQLVDIILADGNSNDGSTEPDRLRSLGVRSLLVTEETGLCTAIRMGMDYAMQQGYEAVITMDGNGKDGIEALPDFIAKLDEGYDLIQGSRFMKGGVHRNTPLERYLGVRYLIAPLLATGGYWYSDPTNAFRAMSMRLLQDDRIQPIRKMFVRFNLQHYINFRAARLKFNVTEIPVTRVYPDDGSIPTKIVSWQTKWLLIKELLLTITGRYNPRT